MKPLVRLERARLLGTTVPVAVATGDRPAVRENREPPPAGIGGTFVFGPAGQRGGPSGFVARYDYEVLPVFPHGDTPGGVFGFHVGYEFWRSGADNWGLSLPIAWVFGARVFPMRTLVGFGVDTFLIDQVANDTGVGFFAPFAMARVGADVKGWQMGLDARVGYRWQVGADDHTRWQLGAYVGKTWEPPARRPLY